MPGLADWLRARWPAYVGSPNPNAAYRVPEAEGQPAARTPYGYWPTYAERGPTQPDWLHDWLPRTTWPEAMTPGGVAAFRLPFMLTPNVSMAAGFGGVDGTQQTAWWLYLPPIAPEQRGGSVRAVAGGRNRASINSRLQTVSTVPSVYVLGE